MLKIICFFIATTSLTFAVPVNRTNFMSWVDIVRSEVFRGIHVTRRLIGTEILWLEDIDFDRNPLSVHFDYIFEETGNREIIKVPNLCGNYTPGSLEHDVQLHVLTKFANTNKCPIRTGTRVFYTMPDAYTFPTENRECGTVDGMIQVFKVLPDNNRISPLYLRVFFRGYVNGLNCS